MKTWIPVAPFVLLFLHPFQPFLLAQDETGEMTITVRSPAFEQDGAIPKKHTCDGENVSPTLFWTGVPADAASVAIIADDPDAPKGTWVHWVVYNLPARIPFLPGNAPPSETFFTGAIHGMTDFERLGYGGPCPPSGTHRYYFKVYALDAMLDLKPGATKEQLLKGMEGHVVAQGELMGKYARSQ